MQQKIKYYIQKILGLFLDVPVILKSRVIGYSLVKSQKANVSASDKTRIVAPFYLKDVVLGDYSYIAKNSHITNTEIGKFCSIGPNFCCGMGIHPTSGVSTSPMFYSVAKQNGFSLTNENKIEEQKKIKIGHDVFVGANAMVFDGISIGNGAVIGAGAVVVKDIPDYAIAVGIPAKVIKYRFEPEVIKKLQKMKWWNFDEEKLKKIERDFFDVEKFVNQ